MYSICVLIFFERNDFFSFLSLCTAFSTRGRSKRTAKKNAIRRIRDAVSSDTTGGDNSNALDSEIHATSEIDDAQSGMHLFSDFLQC